MSEEMLIKADVLSDKFGKIKVTTITGDVLVGESWGIQCATDPETGDELDENCIALKLEDGDYEELTNNEIKSVEKAI